ncbi:leucine-rich repeat flightless-interacting protein 2-like isoform X2, partial [Leptotrombidium deliense]
QKVNEGEERLKEAMVSNGQLEKEKQYYSYQIETLKDDYQDLEESYYKLQRDYKDKSRNYELLNRDFAKIKDDNSYLKECVKQRDQVLKTNGKLTISKECAAMLSNFDGDTVEEKINCIIKEKKEYLNTIKQLKNELENERERNREIENNNHLVNGDVKANEDKMIHDYKFKLLESEKEKNNLQNSITRLETQIERMKLNVDELEKNENDLKIEKRKISRELREATSRIEELETSNIHLQKRIDKLMSSRLANLNSDT